MHDLLYRVFGGSIMAASGTALAASGAATAYYAGKTIVSHLPGPPAHYDPDLDHRNPIEATVVFGAAAVCAMYGVRTAYRGFRTLRVPPELEGKPFDVTVEEDPQ